MKNDQSLEGEELKNKLFLENKNKFSEVFKSFKNNPEDFSPYFENMKEIDAWIKEEYTS